MTFQAPDTSVIAASLRLKAGLCGQGSRQLQRTTSFQSKQDLANEFPLSVIFGTLCNKKIKILCSDVSSSDLHENEHILRKPQNG